jgi:hypothetical protein
VEKMLKFFYTLDYDDDGNSAIHGRADIPPFDAPPTDDLPSVDDAPAAAHDPFDPALSVGNTRPAVSDALAEEGCPAPYAPAQELEEQESLNNTSIYPTAPPGLWLRITILVDYPPLVNARVYALADKYDVRGLKAFSSKKFKNSLATPWSSEVFSEIIRVVYESTPSTDRGLRSIVTETARKRGNCLMDCTEFRVLLESAPDFTIDLLQKVWDAHPCGECGKPPGYGFGYEICGSCRQ